jgi:hypothetical protein
MCSNNVGFGDFIEEIIIFLVLVYLWKSLHMHLLGENTLQWPKNVDTNTIFQNYVILAFSKPILKDVFINYTQNKVVQLPNIVIIK